MVDKSELKRMSKIALVSVKDAEPEEIKTDKYDRKCRETNHNHGGLEVVPAEITNQPSELILEVMLNKVKHECNNLKNKFKSE